MHLTPDQRAELQELFLRFARIDGISLQERRIADAVGAYLRPCGIRVEEDAAGAVIGGTAGNLLCFPPDFRPDEPAIMLTAHLDTVHSTAALAPRLLDDRITSDGSTILGADNRLGLSLLTFLIREVVVRRLPHVNFFVAHTVAEEIGLFGAEQIDLSPFTIAGAYVFDSSRRPGVYVRECVGLSLWEATVHGRAAHAGVAPEEGLNAITLAAAAISRLETGRIDSTMTMNIGRITGGGATNVVPDRVSVFGEVRSFSVERTAERLRLIEATFRSTLNGTGRVDFTSHVDFYPYVLNPGAPFLQRLEWALRANGLEPQPIPYTGGSDANKYNAKGIPAVNLGIGAQKPHTFQEFVLLEDLSSAAGIAFDIIRPENPLPLTA